MKLCTRCNERKPHEDYEKDGRGWDGYKPKCNTCMDYHRMKRKEERDVRNGNGLNKLNSSLVKRRRMVNDLKSEPCMDCHRYFHPVAMDFDHRPGETKSFNISQGVHKPLAVLMAEIAKCDVVCSNCHRVRTWVLRAEGSLPKLS